MRVGKGSFTSVRKFFTLSFASRRSFGTGSLSYIHGTSSSPLLYQTFGEVLINQAERIPDEKVFAFPRQSVLKTYSQLYDDARKFASGLIALGLKKGDRVGMWGPNTYEWIVTQFAVSMSGLIFVTINPAYQTPELEYCLHKVGIKCLVSANRFKTQDYHLMISDLCPMLSMFKPGQLHNDSLPHLKHVVFLDDERKPGCYTFNDVNEAGNKDSQLKLTEMMRKVQPDDAVNIQFTSGTTGAPKGATLSHFNMINNANMIGRGLGYHEKRHVICCVPPLYHCFGCVGGSLCTVLHSGLCVFPAPSFEPLAVLQAVQDYKCNSLYGTPTMFIDMLNHEKFSTFDYTSVTTGIMAGAPCPVELCKRVVRKLDAKNFSVVYGTTENSPATFQTLREDDPSSRFSFVGKLLDHLEAKLIGHDGKIVPLNKPGELCIRGHAVMLGYWNDVEKTNECIGPDRWYKTGDYGIMNEKGYVKIVGRLKDMIIRGGENIYPTEIEEFLFTHPKIVDVHAIGVPDSRMGEEVCVWIRLHAGVTCTEEEIRDFCKGKLAHYKIPKYIVFKQEKDFPLTVTGKVQKYKMKDIAKHELNLGDVKSHYSDDANLMI